MVEGARRPARRQGRDRRHRPSRQPPRALGRRADGEPVPPRPAPHGARHQGAHVVGRYRHRHAAGPDQRQARGRRRARVLRLVAAVAVHGPDQPALRGHAQAPPLGAWPGRSDPRARRLRSARRAPDPLRPHLPDRDAGRPEYRPDQLAGDLRPREQVRLHRDAVPPREGRRRSRDEVVYLSAMEEAKYNVAQANAAMDAQRQADRRPRRLPPRRRRHRRRRPIASTSWTCRRSSSSRSPPRSSRSSRTTTRTARSWARTCSARPCRSFSADAPFVGTGMEAVVARDSGAAIAARRAGIVDQVDATRIVIRATEETDPTKPGVDIYRLQKFQRSNQSTCITQKPLVPRRRRRPQGRHHRRRSVDRARRARARPQRARRVHAVERLQLRGLDPALRADREGRRVHLDPHRGIRGDGPRHQARVRRKSRATFRTSRKRR